jgi:hypothetical protein
MHNWKQIIRKNLRVLHFCSPEFAEKVAEELGSHLQDTYDELLRAGLTETAALDRTLDEIKLCRRNRLVVRLLKEDRMRGFTWKIGIPGLLTFSAAMAISGALEVAHVPSKTILLANGLFLPLPIAWICLLPLCGAMGAVISRRSGGSRLDRMMAGAFPAAIMLAVLLLMFVAGWVISQFVADHAWNWVVAVPGLGLWMTGYVILTATALLLGVAAVDRIKKTQSRAV